MNQQIDIRGVRERAGWSQSDMARAIGVDQARISRMEKNPGDVPLDVYLQISTATGIPMEEILRGSQPGHGLSVAVDGRGYENLRAFERTLREGAFGPDSDEAHGLPGQSDLSGLISNARRKPRVVVTGPFDAGKSTLINLLLGGDTIVPARFTPTTGLVTYLRHIEDRPEWAEEITILDSAFKPGSWADRAHVESTQLRSGELVALRDEVAHGALPDGGRSALIYVDSDILRTCVLVDTPGDDNDDFDSARTREALEEEMTDVLIFMAPVSGFMSSSQQALLTSRLKALSNLGPSLPAAENLFVVASKAAPSFVSDDELTAIFDSAAQRLELASAGTADSRQKELILGIRSRMFAFYRGTGLNEDTRTGSRGQLMIDALRQLLDVEIPTLTMDTLRDNVASYLDRGHAYCELADAELRGLEAETREAEEAIDGLRESLREARDAVKSFEGSVTTSIFRHKRRNLDHVHEVLAAQANPEKIEAIIRTLYSDDALKERSQLQRKRGAKKLAQEEIPRHMLSLVQVAMENEINNESTEFARELDQKLEKLKTELSELDWAGEGDIPLDLDGAIIGAMVSGAAVGALAAWASTLGNLGAYIIAAQAAGWLSAIGISLPAGGATLTAAMAALGGPLGVAIGIIVIGAIAGSFFRDDWQVRLARAVSKQMLSHEVKGKPGLPHHMRDSVRKYWDDTESTLRIAVQSMLAEIQDRFDHAAALLDENSADERAQRRNQIDESRAWLTWLSAMMQRYS